MWGLRRTWWGVAIMRKSNSAATERKNSCIICWSKPLGEPWDSMWNIEPDMERCLQKEPVRSRRFRSLRRNFCLPFVRYGFRSGTLWSCCHAQNKIDLIRCWSVWLWKRKFSFDSMSCVSFLLWKMGMSTVSEHYFWMEQQNAREHKFPLPIIVSDFWFKQKNRDNFTNRRLQGIVDRRLFVNTHKTKENTKKQ